MSKTHQKEMLTERLEKKLYNSLRKTLDLLCNQNNKEAKRRKVEADKWVFSGMQNNQGSIRSKFPYGGGWGA